MSHAGVERRRWPRIPASLLSGVSASLVSGPEVTLVNLSRGGALVQVGSRYPMRSYVRLKLTRSTGQATIAAGTVSWAEVASIVDGHIHYLIAILFEQPIDLAAATGVEQLEAAAEAAPASAVASAASNDAVSGPARDNLTRFPSGTTRIPEHWEKEKASLVQELADAVKKVDALQAALEAREQEQVLALAEQKGRHEALMAELVKAANDQQKEFQQLLAEGIAARDEHRSRAEQLEARYRALRREAATLISMLTQEDVATFQAREASAQAVA